MLPIRPVRGIFRPYEEHLSFYQFAQNRPIGVKKVLPSASGDRKFPHTFSKEALADAEDFARCISSVLSTAGALKDILEDLDETRSGSVLHKRTVISSQPLAVTASAEDGSPLRTLKLEVRKLACVQWNLSAQFTPEAPTTVPQGLNRIRIRKGGQDVELDVFVQPEDTHRRVLSRLQTQVNAAGMGIRALLETVPSTGRIRLTLTGAEPGTANGFKLTDVTGSLGSAASLLVWDQAAADAEVRLSGRPWISWHSNRIPFKEEQLSVELAGLPDGLVDLEILPDAGRLERRILSLLHAVNAFARALREAGDRLHPEFEHTLLGIMDGDTARAARFVRSDGTGWEWNRSSWQEQLQIGFKESIEPFIGETGLPRRLRRLISRMEQGPSESLLNREHPRYKRYANYLATLDWYSQLPARGLLLNRTF